MARDYNISFGYPRTDSCSTCDQFTAQIKSLEVRKAEDTNEEIAEIEASVRKLSTENKLHN